MTQQIAWPPSGGIHIHLNLSTPTMAPTMPVPVIDQLRVQAIDGQLQRLNRWLAEHSRQDYEDSFSDTADAMIAAAEAAQAATVQPVEAALVVGDDPELADYIIGLDAGRHTWRTIPKPVRWRLVKARLNSIWTDGKLPTMADFDAYAPAWMPSANSVAMTFGDGKWSVVCGKAVES